MLEINIKDLIPQLVRQKAMDMTVDFVVNTGKSYLNSEIISKIKKLRSDGAFQNSFEAALQRAGERFLREYVDEDEDLALALANDMTFFEDEQVQQALLKILRNPGVYQADEQTLVRQSFDGILPRRRNRERVNRAVSFFLQCLQEEILWRKGDNNNAYLNCRKALEILRLLDIPYDFALCHLEIARIEYLLGNNIKAENEAKIAYRMFNDLTVSPDMDETVELLEAINQSPDDPSAYLAKYRVRGYENVASTD